MGSRRHAADYRTAYMGLSASRIDLQGSIVALRLYRAFVEEASKMEDELGIPVYGWFTTASVTVMDLMQRVFKGVQPRNDLSYDPDRWPIFETALSRLDDKLALPAGTTRAAAEPDYPFVLRGIASASNFSKSESLRLQGASGRRARPFSRLDVSPERGDRVLFTMSME